MNKNLNTDYLLFLTFFSNLMIVLNVYNGDILGIANELEYLLWYIPAILGSIYKVGFINSLKIYHTLYLGVVVLVFWYFESPFRISKKIRHRTEYYDTHALMCGLLYHTIFELFR